MLIELAGIPNSGKDEILRELQKIDRFSPVIEVREDSRDGQLFSNDYFELRVLWTNLRRCSRMKNIVSGHENFSGSNLVVFNRGLLDSIVFSRLISSEKKSYKDLMEQSESWIKSSGFLNQINLTFIFLTSFEKAYNRKLEFKSKPNMTFRLVQPNTISALNKIYLDIYLEFRSQLPIVLLDDLNEDLSLQDKLSIVSSRIDEWNKENQ